jgi:hypothetical protein
MRSYTLMNEHDPNETIELGAQADLLDAAYAALEALGWMLTSQELEDELLDLDEDDNDE